jgi:hypothetical protein
MRVVRLRVTRVPVAVLTLAVIGVAASCSANPQVELTQSAPGSGSSPTVTVTVSEWRTVTQTMTATTTVATPTTVLATPTVTVTLPARPALTRTTAFNQTVALAMYQQLIGDITSLDAAPVSGSRAALQLDALVGHLASIESMAAPPGLDPPSWFGRVGSLRLFADAASSEAQAGSPQAPARYTVIRAEVGVLLSMVNGALHTSLTLPPAPIGSR